MLVRRLWENMARRDAEFGVGGEAISEAATSFLGEEHREQVGSGERARFSEGLREVSAK
jgi:hypothetical protein